MGDPNAMVSGISSAATITTDASPEVERAFFTALRETETAADAVSKCAHALIDRLAPLCSDHPVDSGVPAQERNAIPLVERLERLRDNLNDLAGATPVSSHPRPVPFHLRLVALVRSDRHVPRDGAAQVDLVAVPRARLSAPPVRRLTFVPVSIGVMLTFTVAYLNVYLIGL